MKEFALYKGEQIICIGTAKEIAKETNVSIDTIYFYNSPTYKEKRKPKKLNSNRKVLIELVDDESEESNEDVSS